MSVATVGTRVLRLAFGGVDALVPQRTGITVLAYHRVGATTPVSVDLPDHQMAEQLDALAAVRTVSLDDAAALLAPGSVPSVDVPSGGLRSVGLRSVGLRSGGLRSGARPTVVLTADDGTADWVDRLLPMLVDRALPMTWYVATRFVDEGREFPNGGAPVSWAGLADAVATGLITIGSHTHSHAVMGTLDSVTAASELDRSIGLIEDHLGRACLHFAYPKAIAPSDASDAEVRRRFRTAALAGNRVNVPGRTDLARLGRTPVQRRDGTAAFARKMRGGGRAEGWAREHLDRRRHRGAVS